MKAIVKVTLRKGILDPQGKAIGSALNQLGFAEVGDLEGGYTPVREVIAYLRSLPDAELGILIDDWYLAHTSLVARELNGADKNEKAAIDSRLSLAREHANIFGDRTNSKRKASGSKSINIGNVPTSKKDTKDAK